MKKYAKLIKLTLIATLFVSMFSCSDDDTVEIPINYSVSAVASRAPQFTTLVAALDKAGLVQTLDQNGPFTVFAPTNQAFTDAGIDINTIDVDVLRQVLLNHVVMGTNLSTGLATGYLKSMGKGAASDTNTLSLFVNTADGVVINGVAEVTTPDILASNGVIHEVDAVIGLATIADHAIANPALSTLTSLLVQQDLVTPFQEPGVYTVFAPSDAAFTTFEDENPGVLASLTSDQVTSVLTYHVVAGANVLSTEIPTTPITTLESGEITIAGTVITDEQDRATNLVTTVLDIQTSNGVVHVIDNVLLPILE